MNTINFFILFSKGNMIFTLGIIIIVILFELFLYIIFSIKRKDKFFFTTNLDSLTGIYTKKLFLSKADKMIKKNNNKLFMIIILDIKRISVIKEFLGVEGSKDLLLKLSDDIHTLFKNEPFTVYGKSDESYFVWITPYSMDSINRYQKHFEDFLNENNINFNYSMGITIIDNINLPIDVFYDRAVIACKQNNSNANLKYNFFNIEYLENIKIEDDISAKFEDAIKNKEFKVFLQPKYNLNSEKVCGAEALIRWVRNNEFISPGLFIPVLEKKGLISKLDYYVCREICNIIKEWKENNKYLVPISINISKVDLYDKNFFNKIIKLLDENEISHDLIHFEFTESIYFLDKEVLANIIEFLHKEGFIVLMDDFGSGYSSLNMLKDYKLDAIKVDMEFLASNDDNRSFSILSSVIKMLKGLNYHIIVEGVETFDQMNLLRSLGVEEVQGYYFNRPLPIDKFNELQIDKEVNIYKYDGVVNNKIEEIWSTKGIISDILESTNAGIAIYELSENSLKCLRLNDKYFEMMSITRKEYYTNDYNHFDNLNEINKKILLDLFEQASNTTKMVEGKISRKINNNFSIRIKLKIKFICDNENKKLFYAILEDITDETKLTNEINEIKKMVEYSTENSNRSIWEYDFTNKMIRFIHKSKKFQNFDDVYYNFPDCLFEVGFFHKDSIPVVKKVIERVLNGSESEKADLKLFDKTNNIYWWERIFLTISFDENNKPIKANAISEDVTEELESFYKLSLIMNWVNCPVISLDIKNFTIKESNKYFKALFKNNSNLFSDYLINKDVKYWKNYILDGLKDNDKFDFNLEMLVDNEKTIFNCSIITMGGYYSDIYLLALKKMEK